MSSRTLLSSASSSLRSFTFAHQRPKYHSTMQHAIPASYYRGGTSRAIMFQEPSLPSSKSDRESLFLQVMGTPDPNGRQLDGFGAGVSSLSKICVVGKPSAASPAPNGISSADVTAHVTYTFVGLGIETPVIDMAGNCGNMSSAIGPFAFNQRMLGTEAEYDYKLNGEGEATVLIFNTNTRKHIRSTFPVKQGQAMAAGDYEIDGVHGKGARIRLDYLNPAGAKTGKLTPTGAPTDDLKLDGQIYKVSCVDAANPVVFVRAADFGVPGTILPNDFKTHPGLGKLKRLREIAAVKMGVAKTLEDVPRTIPKVALVSKAATQTTLSGKEQGAEAMDVLLRVLSDDMPHGAIPLTAALCTACAARVPGTIVNDLLSEGALGRDGIRIAHPSGIIEVGATVDNGGNVTEATVFRTAKRLMDGEVYYSK